MIFFFFRTLSITNKTNALWTLKPVIDAEYWSGPLTFTVEPQTMNKGYPISYHPLTMTQEGKKHTVRDQSRGIHSVVETDNATSFSCFISPF